MKTLNKILLRGIIFVLVACAITYGCKLYISRTLSMNDGFILTYNENCEPCFSDDNIEVVNT